MPLPRPSPLLAVGAVSYGAALFGPALGGIATVDGELRAAVAPAPPTSETLRVSHPVAPATRGQTPGCSRNEGSDPSLSLQRDRRS